MRILHLINPASAGGGPCTLRLAAEAISRLAEDSHEVLLIGSGAGAAAARRCGLSAGRGIGVALNRPAFGRPVLARTIAEMESARGAFDLVHAWTADLAAAARGRPAICTVLAGAPGREPAERGGGHATFLAATPEIARRLGANGIPSTVLPPGVDASAVVREDRALLRQRWSADETTFITALLGEPAAAQDGELSLATVARASMTGRDVRIVVHHDEARRMTTRRWLGKLGMEKVVLIDDDVLEPWRVVAGLDAALVAPLPGRSTAAVAMQHLPLIAGAMSWAAAARPRSERGVLPSVLPAAWAMAAGVPVVAPDSVAGGRIVEDGRTGLLYEPGDFNSAATRILDLHEDARFAARIGAAGRALVEERFDPDRFAARLGRIYRQVARGEPVRVQDEEERSAGPAPLQRPAVASSSSNAVS